MKNLFLASATAAVLALVPAASQAFWNMPQSSAGYPLLGSWAINQHPSKFFEGPLYNYGPIVPGPGYQIQYVQQPLCGLYIPADPSTYIPLNYQDANTWGYVNPGIAGTPGSLPAYYGLYYGMPGQFDGPPPPMSAPAPQAAPSYPTKVPSSPTTTPSMPTTPAPTTTTPPTPSAPKVMQTGDSQMAVNSSVAMSQQLPPMESSSSSPIFFKNLRARLQR